MADQNVAGLPENMVTASRLVGRHGGSVLPVATALSSPTAQTVSHATSFFDALVEIVESGELVEDADEGADDLTMVRWSGKVEDLPKTSHRLKARVLVIPAA